MKVLFSSNVSWSIYNFRMELLKTLQSRNFEVHVVAAKDEYSDRLKNEGFHYREIEVRNNSKNPFKDLLLIYNYYKIYKEIKPDVVLHNAIKPNIYGSIAAGLLKIPAINNISGLGTLFIKKNFSTQIALWLYWFSQKFASIVLFQNPHDLSLFTTKRLVPKTKCKLIPGSGVNTKRFSPDRLPKNFSNKFRFLFVGRLLFDKGIREYVEAARRLIKKYNHIECNILGPFYEDNSTGISKSILNEWISEKGINYLGKTDHVEQVFAKTDCVVLPSYREGLSKVLIEASSMGLPIVTTDVPGCKDVVVDKVTGFLCRPKDSKDLELKMEKILLLDKDKFDSFGKLARQRAIEKFDVGIVIEEYFKAIYSSLNLKMPLQVLPIK